MMVEIWDGYYADGTLAGIDLIRDEAIPTGLYHLVCEVLVRHRDGSYLLMQRDYSKKGYPGYFEATAGGSALKGEDALACAKRELLEETGIRAGHLEQIVRNVFDDDCCIYYSFLCETGCDKSAVTLQPGETIAYRWVEEEAFSRFVNSDRMIDTQKRRYLPFLRKMGYI